MNLLRRAGNRPHSRGAEEDRTPDLFVANEALSQTELQPRVRDQGSDFRDQSIHASLRDAGFDFTDP